MYFKTQWKVILYYMYEWSITNERSKKENKEKKKKKKNEWKKRRREK